MSTPHDPNEERAEETKQVRVTHEETLSIARNGSASRRNLVMIVAAVAVFAVVVILGAFFWLRGVG